VKFFHPLLVFLIHLGYFGPLVMGVLDSSFLVLPFGNDLLLVYMVAQKHHGAPWYVLAAATGSTIGAATVALVARKVGKQGISKFAGEKQFNKLQSKLSHRAAAAIALGALAPPPFPYTLVVAAASALDKSMPEILVTNFFARAARFAILAWLAEKFGKQVLEIAQTAPFRWTIIGFTVVCLVASGISVWRWVHGVRSQRGEQKQGQPSPATAG
jgi:membrane protein YqaA with SNARE-associated domain